MRASRLEEGHAAALVARGAEAAAADVLAQAKVMATKVEAAFGTVVVSKAEVLASTQAAQAATLAAMAGSHGDQVAMESATAAAAVAAATTQSPGKAIQSMTHIP